MTLERLLVKEFGNLYSESLGIALDSKKNSEIFKWFLASILFGKRIGENTAAKTYKEFEKENLTTPENILDAGWDKLVAVLDSGGYIRYDFSTASKLLTIMNQIQKKYGGSLSSLYELSADSKELENRLLEFSGVGPVTVNIFLRELRHVWKKVDPNFSPFVKDAAEKLKIDLKKYNRKTKSFVRLECALLRLGKNFCRKKKCTDCQFKSKCKLW